MFNRELLGESPGGLPRPTKPIGNTQAKKPWVRFLLISLLDKMILHQPPTNGRLAIGPDSLFYVDGLTLNVAG